MGYLARNPNPRLRAALGDASAAVAATACNANPLTVWDYSTSTCGPLVKPTVVQGLPLFTCPSGVQIQVTNLANPGANCPPPVVPSSDGTISILGMAIPTTYLLIGAAGVAFLLIRKKRST